MSETLLQMCVADYIVEKAPPTAYYVPDFITADEEHFLLDRIYSAPKPKWRQLAHRRLQNWGGLPHPKGMVTEDLPEWLSRYVVRIASLGVFGDKQPNHVLVNEYLPGQGIMPHTDGPLFHPIISTINLGSHTVLRLYGPRAETDATTCSDTVMTTTPAGSLFLQPRSLLILRDDLYSRYHHGIDEVVTDVADKHDQVFNADATGHLPTEAGLQRGTRVSLTVRHVPKTFKFRFT